MQKAETHIRLAHLPTPFAYRTMAEVEVRRTHLPDLPHRHDHFTVILVEAAEGTHQIDFIEYPLRDNTAYFVSPEQIHHLTLTQPHPRGHVILFRPDFLQQYSFSPSQLSDMDLFFNCDEALPLTFTSDEMSILLPLVKGIAEETQSELPQKWEAVGAWLKLFLLQCKRFKSAQKVLNRGWDNRQAEIVKHFKNDVEQFFHKFHKVNEYADRQHLTANHLNDVIKSETGTSAKEFIQNRLVLEAKRLARYSELSAKEIAYQLGYDDIAHFSRFFKKSEGIAFSEFRENAEP
ncbi:AraC family transcriptional regulator [Runella sp.]|uniref:AraC family transcriptional regulator n=1 Tax=Runella sp. TaxID=1960881 RepID=UPI003D128670